MDKDFNGRVIYLSEEASHFPRIEKVVDGVVMQQKRVLVDDLLESMFSIIEPAMQMKHLLKADDFFNDVLLPVIQEAGDKKPAILSSLFRHLTNSLSQESIEDKEKVIQVLDSFLENFKKYNLNTMETMHLFMTLAKHIQSEDNEQLVAELYLHLLAGVDLAGEASNELLKKTLDEIMKVNNPLKEDYLSKLLRRYKEKHVVCTSPILPKGTLLYQEDNRGGYIIAIEVEPQQRDVMFYQTTFENVGHPRLIFVFEVNESRTAKANLFAVKDPVIKATTKLYRYPFANVYSNGSCCWPELSSVSIEDPVQLSNLVHLFFNSPHNNHLFNGENLRELFSKLSGKDFDFAMLKPFGTTFGSYLSLMKTKKTTNNAVETTA